MKKPSIFSQPQKDSKQAIPPLASNKPFTVLGKLYETGKDQPIMVTLLIDEQPLEPDSIDFGLTYLETQESKSVTARIFMDCEEKLLSFSINKASCPQELLTALQQQAVVSKLKITFRSDEVNNYCDYHGESGELYKLLLIIKQQLKLEDRYGLYAGKLTRLADLVEDLSKQVIDNFSKKQSNHLGLSL